MDKAHVQEPSRLGATAGYMDTPQGIWTRSGFHFRTTEALLKAYAAPVFEHVTMDRLLKTTIDWLRAPENLAVCLLPILLLNLPAWTALGITMIVYAVWKLISPSMVSLHILPIFSFLSWAPVQAGLYLVVLSLLGMRGDYLALGVGTVFFVFVRWGGLSALAGLLFRPIYAVVYAAPVNDRVLKSMIIRLSLRHRLSMPELDTIEERLMDLMRKK